MMNLLRNLDRKAHAIVNEIDRVTMPRVFDIQPPDVAKQVDAFIDRIEPNEGVVMQAPQEAAPQMAPDTCCTAEATA